MMRRHSGRGHGRGYGRGRRQDGTDTTLDRVRAGDRVEVLSVDDDRARVHALRFGMCSGSNLSCVTKVPAGPVIVRQGRQEIAVGRGLASRIRVRRCDECGKRVN